MLTRDNERSFEATVAVSTARAALTHNRHVPLLASHDIWRVSASAKPWASMPRRDGRCDRLSLSRPRRTDSLLTVGAQQLRTGPELAAVAKV